MQQRVLALTPRDGPPPLCTVGSMDGDEDGPIPPEMYARDPDENAVDLDRPFSRWQRAEFFELARVGFWLAVVLACMAIMIGSIVRQWRMLLPLARELGWI